MISNFSQSHKSGIWDLKLHLEFYISSIVCLNIVLGKQASEPVEKTVDVHGGKDWGQNHQTGSKSELDKTDSQSTFL